MNLFFLLDEGYIKFRCDWIKSGLPSHIDTSELLKVRDKVFEMGLIGYDEKEKVGFGNISERYRKNEFIISGTQTGHIKNLLAEHLSHIKNFSVEKNSVHCCGPAKASSESLTHAAIYQYFKNVNAVIHIHSEKFWNLFLNKLPTTNEKIPYGTPEMALSVKDLFKDSPFISEGVFIMGGHKDGIICFGRSLGNAFEELQRLTK